MYCIGNLLFDTVEEPSIGEVVDEGQRENQFVPTDERKSEMRSAAECLRVVEISVDSRVVEGSLP